MKEQIERFRSLGFQVWMDDFGSGYSSLDTLQMIQFDLVKFDMSFMRQFDNGDKSKIILTELMKMALGISLETVCEGVERIDQSEFLKEIGCSKLQGYLYEKPIPLTQLLSKYKSGTEIGFEDPEQIDYYDSIGKISLYDTAMISNGGMDKENTSAPQYFDTIPMAVIEIKDGKMHISRSNKSYREFNERLFGNHEQFFSNEFYVPKGRNGIAFLKAMGQSCREKDRTIFEDILPDGKVSHTFIKWLAENKKTGAQAIAVAVLAVTDNNDVISYANIARALATNYFNIFYVNINDESYIEFTSDKNTSDNFGITVESRGENFFEKARKDALIYIHKDDIHDFLKVFKKKNIMHWIDKCGYFLHEYRLLTGADYIHANMKAVRMDDGKHIILGVSNVEEQFRQQKLADQLKQEQLLYSRLTALAGDYIVVYTVDLKTDKYIECNSTEDFSGLGVAEDGDDFFNKSIENGRNVVFEEDFPAYEQNFSKENILREIKEKGSFTLRYRIVIGKTVMTIELHASVINEDDGEKLIIGIKRVS